MAMCDFALCDGKMTSKEDRPLCFLSSFINYECSINVVSIIELTVYTLCVCDFAIYDI